MVGGFKCQALRERIVGAFPQGTSGTQTPKQVSPAVVKAVLEMTAGRCSLPGVERKASQHRGPENGLTSIDGRKGSS